MKLRVIPQRESGLGEEAAALVDEAGVLILDPERLAGFEAVPAL